ncbi:GNAT family N-acetyltransferase [Endozoicomonas atrinae]|uniref:GNAT family N-acetyltransferase n=1 Tax=Endozoicomonas atrinae TaxID=1333660 RepID=UPI003AFFBFDD
MTTGIATHSTQTFAMAEASENYDAADSCSKAKWKKLEGNDVEILFQGDSIQRVEMQIDKALGTRKVCLSDKSSNPHWPPGIHHLTEQDMISLLSRTPKEPNPRAPDKIDYSYQLMTTLHPVIQKLYNKTVHDNYVELDLPELSQHSDIRAKGLKEFSLASSIETANALSGQAEWVISVNKEGECDGFLNFWPLKTDKPGITYYIDQMGVETRGQGLGKKLFDAAIQQINCTDPEFELLICTRTGNKPAIHLYEGKCGMERCSAERMGRDPDRYIGFKKTFTVSD